jgi:hypothetical protein
MEGICDMCDNDSCYCEKCKDENNDLHKLCKWQYEKIEKLKAQLVEENAIHNATIEGYRNAREEYVAEIERLKEILKIMKEYNDLLGDEMNQTVLIAHRHGWQSEKYEKGLELRDKLKELEG